MRSPATYHPKSSPHDEKSLTAMMNSRARSSMLRVVSKSVWSSLVVALAAGLSFATLAYHAEPGQNAHPGPVTGVIDSVRFEGDQFYIFGWACQEGQRGSLDVHLYADHAAGDKPPGMFV